MSQAQPIPQREWPRCDEPGDRTLGAGSLLRGQEAGDHALPERPLGNPRLVIAEVLGDPVLDESIVSA